MSGQLESTTTRPSDDPAGSPPRPLTIAEQTWRSIGSGLSIASLAAVMAVILGELDRLISSVPAGDGRSHSLNVVLSPIGPTKTESWGQWADAALHGQLGWWIALSAVLDLALAAALAALLYRLVKLAPWQNRPVPLITLAFYAAAELFEDVLQFAGGLLVSAGAASEAGLVGMNMAVPTAVKTLSLLVFAIAVLRIRPYRRALRRGIARIAQALWVHRLATLAILVILVLACIPAADLLDQLPDVQRSWADGFGWVHAVFAFAALAITGAVALALGRRRTRFLVETRILGRHRNPAGSPLEAAAPWLIGPVVLIGAAAIAVVGAATFGGDPAATVHWPTFVVLVAILLLVPYLAIVGFAYYEGKPDRVAEHDPARARFGWIVGDSLAILVLVAGAIGIVRSFVVPLLLGDAVGVPSAVRWSWFVVPLGVLAAVLAPWVFFRRVAPRPLSRSLDPNPTTRTDEMAAAVTRSVRSPAAPPVPSESTDEFVSRPGRAERWSLALALVLLLVAMLWPSQIAAALGSVAVTLLAISAWVAAFGAFTIIVQTRELVAPFRWLHLKASPVLTLGILLPFALNVAMSSYAPDRTLHAVEVSNPDPVVDADDEILLDHLRGMQDETSETGPDACTIAAVGGADDRVRPVFLIAAEGGGIRAAYWTAASLATLEGCAARSGYAANGISGGSVGLAVASTVDDAPGQAEFTTDRERAEEIVERTKRVAGPDVVSTVVLALAVGDMFAAGSGIHMPSYLDDTGGADDHGWRWRDRAALVEALWERAAPGLSTQFSAEIDPLTGMLMLSSTDVVTKCRLLVDQAPVRLPSDEDDDADSAAASGAAAPDQQAGDPCEAVGGLPSMLGFRELPASGGIDATTRCLASLDWSTAAMLSARFAVITPTGGLPAKSPCDEASIEQAQFVDGGYVEPTALAALADSAPRLMELIEVVNADRDENEAWLVPVLLYLRNTQGYDLAKDVARAESEPLVPITGNAAKVHLTAEASWIQRITLSMPQACPDTDEGIGCQRALAALIARDGALPGGTVVVAPASTPAVVPPLGWALSELSQARFASAVGEAAGCPTGGTGTEGEAQSTAETEEFERPDGYVGLREFATKVYPFDLCGQLQAQEDSRTAPDTRAADD